MHSTTYTREMMMIHRVFRREAAQLHRFVRAATPGDLDRARQLSRYGREYIAGLHHHHATEDALIWPLLHERARIHLDLVDRMQMQHQALDATLSAVEERLSAWEVTAEQTDQDAAADSVDEHLQVLLEHLGDEEQQVMPLVEQYLTGEEWERVGRAGMENLPKEKVFVALGAILEEADDEERRFFLAKVPVTGRVLWRLVGRRQYARQMALLRDGH